MASFSFEQEPPQPLTFEHPAALRWIERRTPPFARAAKAQHWWGWQENTSDALKPQARKGLPRNLEPKTKLQISKFKGWWNTMYIYTYIYIYVHFSININNYKSISQIIIHHYKSLQTSIHHDIYIYIFHWYVCIYIYIWCSPPCPPTPHLGYGSTDPWGLLGICDNI